jgi:hypothetical protein
VAQPPPSPFRAPYADSFANNNHIADISESTGIDMSDRSAASGTAAGVSHLILQQANPDCDTCASALTRSHKRYRERMEAIRNSERLERYYNELEFEYKNYRLTAERKIGRFEQNAAAYKAALENTIPLEEHNAKSEFRA